MIWLVGTLVLALPCYSWLISVLVLRVSHIKQQRVLAFCLACCASQLSVWWPLSLQSRSAASSWSGVWALWHLLPSEALVDVDGSKLARLVARSEGGCPRIWTVAFSFVKVCGDNCNCDLTSLISVEVAHVLLTHFSWLSRCLLFGLRSIVAVHSTSVCLLYS